MPPRSKSTSSLLAVRLLGLVALTGGVALSAVHARAVSYEVGFISGTVLTTSGQPVPSVRVTARSLSSSGSVTTYASETGQYTLEVPTGDYAVAARYESVPLGQVEVTVVGQQTQTASFSFEGAAVHGHISADGGAAPYARAYLQELGPADCSIAESCDWIDPNQALTNCYGCTDGARYFDCYGSDCYWWDTASFNAYADANGDFTKLVVSGSYDVTAYSGNVSGQSGNVSVASAQGTVDDGVDLFLPDLAYETAFVSGTVTRNGQPLPSARIDASLPGSGTVRVHADATGAYSLQLPLGDYTVYVRTPDNDLIATEDVVVDDPQSTQPLNFDYISTDGELVGEVIRDGAGAPYARLYVYEQGPASCDAADACDWIDPSNPQDQCYGCTSDGRSFDCWGSECYWWDPQNYNIYADQAGAFDQTVAAGTYDVTVYSGNEPGQSGYVQVANFSAIVPAGGQADLGSIAYQTGIVSGTVTNCGGPMSGVSVDVYSPSVGGSIRGYPDAGGAFVVRVPTGDFVGRVRWENVYLTSQPLAVTSGATVDLSHDADNGQLRGTILRDGQPAVGARAYIQERGPDSCAVAVSCDWTDPNDSGGTCYGCTDGVRNFDCYGSDCYWWDTRSLNAYTGADGTFLRDVPEGIYDVHAYSANVSQQSGQILVGIVEAQVGSCELSEIGASGTVVDPADSGTPVVLDEGVQLTFDNVTGGGSVSFVSTSTPQGTPDPDIRFLGQYYDFLVEATFDGLVEVCLPYDPAEVNNLNQLKIFHDVDGSWIQLDVTVDEQASMACAYTDSFSWYVLGEVLNSPPVADAGEAFEVSADEACQGLAGLDGSGSADPDGSSDIVSYAWDLDGTPIAGDATPAVALGLGEHLVRLTVTDAAGESHSDTVRVTVVDDTPPTLELSGSPEVLWPPNGKLRAIEPSWVVADNCDEAPTVVLDHVTSATAPEEDIVLDDGIELRARREGNEAAGRTYTIEYSAFDASGNTTSDSATVVVPHDQGAQ